jgi:hypothetical protein
LLLLSSGTQYEGEWAADRKAGQGVLQFASGSLVRGLHTDAVGLADPQAQYEGGFVDGKFHGQGRFFWQSGVYYEGEFANGAITGRGSKVFPDKSRINGIWKNGTMRRSLDPGGAPQDASLPSLADEEAHAEPQARDDATPEPGERMPTRTAEDSTPLPTARASQSQLSATQSPVLMGRAAGADSPDRRALAASHSELPADTETADGLRHLVRVAAHMRSVRLTLAPCTGAHAGRRLCVPRTGAGLCAARYRLAGAAGRRTLRRCDCCPSPPWLVLKLANGRRVCAWHAPR